RQSTVEEEWVSLAKGGDYAQYYSDLHLVVEWADDGRRLSEWKLAQLAMGRVTANNSQCWNRTKYRRPGLTWSLRSQRGFSARYLPRGTIFGSKGPGAFGKNDSPLASSALCAVLNSTPFRGFLATQMTFGSYEVGVIQRTPVPDLSPDDENALAAL